MSSKQSYRSSRKRRRRNHEAGVIGTAPHGAPYTSYEGERAEGDKESDVSKGSVHTMGGTGSASVPCVDSANQKQL